MLHVYFLNFQNNFYLLKLNSQHFLPNELQCFQFCFVFLHFYYTDLLLIIFLEFPLFIFTS